MKITRRKLPRDQAQQDRILRRAIAGFGAVFLLAVGLLAWKLPSSNSNDLNDINLEPNNKDHKSHWKAALQKQKHHRSISKGQHRLALLLPFVGDGPSSLPSYLPLFCRGAGAAANVADFFLIHNGVFLYPQLPDACRRAPNVFFVNLGTTEAMAERLLRVLDLKHVEKWKIPPKQLLQILTQTLDSLPYTLVEYKPAYGHVFSDLIEEYTHWGYTDLDMVFGDLGRHMEPHEWTDYDLVTFGFGDQARLYVKGQFTMHKNTEQVRQLWRGCDYLSHLDNRFSKMLLAKDKNPRFQLESAEGCYSAELLKNKHISIKYAVKAWTDISLTDTAYAYGVYLYQPPKNLHQRVLAKALKSDDESEQEEAGERLIHLASDWFLHDEVYRDTKQTLYTPMGAMEAIKLPHYPKDANIKKCMYWVQEKYQRHLCLNHPVSPVENVFWVQGKLYKQAFTRTPLSSKVDTGPFFHFQEWKRRYRPAQLAALQDNPHVQVAALLPEGAVAVVTSASSRKGWRQRKLPLSPLGIFMDEWRALAASNKKTTPKQTTKDNEEQPTESRAQLPSQSYCLSGETERFKLECDPLVSWKSKKDVQFLSKAPAWKQFSADVDVTLILTLQIHESNSLLDGLLSNIKENIQRWLDQPVVLLIYLSPMAHGAMDRVQSMVTDLGELAETCLIAYIAPPQPKDDEDVGDDEFLVSSKALQNMAMDVVPTRWYLSGLNDGRAVLSPDTVKLSRRAASHHQSGSGNVFLLPQFAIPDKYGWNLSGLAQAREEHQIHMPSDLQQCHSGKGDKDDDQMDKDDAISDVLSRWWKQTFDSVKGDAKGKVLDVLESALENKLVESLEKATTNGFMSVPHSPLLLVDNDLGHGSNQRSHLLVREVEEFGGGRCFNWFRLVQMIVFGFQLHVLEGAFALESDHLPRHDKDLVSCSGCFLLEEELRDSILRHEIDRPIVYVSLWKQRIAYTKQ